MTDSQKPSSTGTNCDSCLDHILKSVGVPTYCKDKEVSGFVKLEIFNILKDPCLTNLLVGLKERNFIEYSDNKGNTFDEENEVKILEINYLELIDKILQIGGTKTFDGEVEDFYFDYEDKRLDDGFGTDGEKLGKRSFRIREKISNEGIKTFYYTIKRKLQKSDAKEGIIDGLKKKWKKIIGLNTQKHKGKEILRKCYEKEFEINGDDYSDFVNVLNSYGIYEFRSKVKKRVSYYLEDSETKGQIKFDMDFYVEDGYPPLLEIEADNDEVAMKYIKILGLENNVTLQTGYRGLVKYYSNLKKSNKGKKKTKK